MKKLILILITILLIISCGTSRKFNTTFYEGFSIEPQRIIDSITTANLLPASIEYQKWPKLMYFTSDSVITTQYTTITTKEDTTYIFSITESAGDSIYLIKFRKE